MNSDTELAQWRRQWQAAGGAGNEVDAAEALRRRVTRNSRLQTIGLIVPIIVTIGIGGGTIARALTSGSPADAVLAAETWVFILVTWIGSLWLARGTWRPLTQTTAAFIDISIRRCRSNLRAASFAAWLYICQLLFVVVWKFFSSAVEPMVLLTAWPVILIGWVGVPVFFICKSWFVRVQHTALDRLFELERQLKAGPADEA